MEGLLAEFNPEFYFMRLYDFHESVEVFAADKNIDMIIIAPRYHNFFERLFKTQHTQKNWFTIARFPCWRYTSNYSGIF